MISASYHVRVDYKCDYSKGTKPISDIEYVFFNNIGVRKDVDEAETHSGNPTCEPYLYVEVDSLELAQELEREMKKIVTDMGGRLT